MPRHRQKNTILSIGSLSQPTSQCQWHQADHIFDINAVSWLRLRTACVARLLPLLILLSLLTLPASLQAQGSPYTRYTYTTKNGTITITGCNPLNDDLLGPDGWIVIIPSTINGTPVTCIGDGVFSSDSITSVTIPNSVTSIGDSAFSGCSSLSAITVNADNLFYSSVDGVLFNKSQTTLIQFPSSKSESGMLTQYYIPNSVTSIRDQAFSGCSSLTDVTIPMNVTSIGNSAFAGCGSLSAITVDANNPFYSSLDGVLFNKSKTTLIQFPGGKSGTYTIPNSVTSIGDGAFSNFSSLSAITVDANNPFYSSLDGVLFDKNKTTLIQFPRGKSGSYTIPSSVTSIGDGAFSGCWNLDVTIPNSVTSIGDSAFSRCNLTGITIPNSVTSIGDSAFSGCENLTSVTIPNSVTSIGNSAFYGCNLTSVTIPNSVTSIGDSAFSDFGNLRTIIVNALNPFYSSLDGVLFDKNKTTLIQFPRGKSGSYTIPSSVTSIGDGAFSGCWNLDVTIPNSVTSIGDSAFSGCENLTSVTIPNSVTSIGSAAFSRCWNVSDVTIPNNVTNIGSAAFYGCNLTSVTIPNSVTSIGDSAFSGCSYTVDALNPFYSSLDGVLFNKSKTTLIQFPRGKAGSYTIPSSVTSIGDSAFSHCENLTSVTIPNSVISIGNLAFSSCSLTSVTIPSSVTSIGNLAFLWCSLTNVTIPNRVSSIGDWTFHGCYSLSSITIGNSVTSIGDSAFSECSLTSVTIPNSVTSIGNLAFGNSEFSGSFGFSSLTNVTIPNSVTSIGDSAFSGCSSLISVTIPNRVRSIGGSTFYGCYGLTSVTIGNTVSSIGSSAFSSCSSLTNITIPNSVASIGDEAFYGCTKLTRVTIPNSVISIGDSAFSGCSSLTSVTIPSQVTSIKDSTFGGCYSLSSITIGNCVTNIGGWAFSGCSSLVSVTIGNSVVSLGDSSFASCIRLSRLSIGSSVANIGNSAFSDCSNLINVTIPYSVTNIGQSAFLNCASLMNVYFQGNAPGSYNSTVFSGDKRAIAYYLSGTMGWDAPLWGIPTVLWSGPLISQGPTNKTIFAGSSVTFGVTASGDEPLYYQWQFNGNNIPGATRSAYAIGAAKTQNAGSYTVIVTNAYGAVTTSPATLTVLETVKPSVTITTPKANLVVSNSILSIQGTAKDNVAVASVSYRINSNTWTLAQGTSNWTGQVTLSQGMNTIQSCATDSSGNISPTVSVKVTYVPTARLGATVVGSGAISGSVATKTNASAAFAIGKSATLTATAAKGQAFQGWTGWTNSPDATIKFTMPGEDVDLTARFVTSPFPAAAGVYKGLITPEDPFDTTNYGAFVVTVTASGGYSAKLSFLAQTVLSTGQLGLDATAPDRAASRFPIKIGTRSMNVEFLFMLGFSSEVSGSLIATGTDNPYLLQIRGNKVANTNLGLFNVAIRATDANLPPGNGYGSVSISSTGVKINLTLSDDRTAVTALMADRLKSGEIPVFAPLYGNKGFLSGWLTVTDQQIPSSLLVWHKAAGASATYFKGGFDQWVEVQGGVYTSVTNLAQWETSELVIDGEPVLNGYVDYTHGTYSKGFLSIPVSDGQFALTPWVITAGTGAVKLNSGGVSGTGILVPITAPQPGIYGFTAKIVNGLGVVHSVNSGNALSP